MKRAFEELETIFGSLLECIYRWREWCEMKLNRKVPDQMSLFLAGLDKRLNFI